MDENSYKKLDSALCKKSLSIKEFQKLIENELVSSVASVESDKKYEMRYEITLVNGNKHYVYVKMTLEQMINVLQKRKKN